MVHEPEVLAMFKASVQIALGNGCATLFWEDSGINEQSAIDIAPEAVALAACPCQLSCSTCDYGTMYKLCILIRLTFSSGGNDFLGRLDDPIRCVEYTYSTGNACKDHLLN
ncbi:hypothetical protein E2562_039029 [Oryza meyeriana var. granulata]|uniref:Uncharacterized protein n=1 Tax=Oryza meyeriana var. granulata TaxID=110450 RepID=A0A6G1DB25_9ORYZ|nr:hypothetical protein E2562_039029 [Oryza meyeriana var. granulata]